MKNKHTRDEGDEGDEGDGDTEYVRKRCCQSGLWNKFDDYKPNDGIICSGTDVKNYIMNDTVLDYFKYKGIPPYINNCHRRNTGVRTSSSTTSSTSSLYQSGHDFEKVILGKLRKTYTVTTINTFGSQGYTMENVEATIKAIMRRDEIIYQGVLKDVKSGIGGCPDLIVRGDVLSQITNNCRPDRKALTRCQYVTDDKYYIIDIKWTTLPLCVCDNLIRNDKLFPAYKGQLAIYTYLLSKITGTQIDRAFILGKGWKTDYLSGNDPFDLLGVIDYSEFDRVTIERTSDAIQWIHYIRSDTTSHWSKARLAEEVKINCKNVYDDPYHEMKSKLAVQLGELTQIWNVSGVHRDIAQKSGIMSISDPRLTAELMGFKGKNAKCINNILKANRSTDIIVSDDLSTLPDHRQCYYVDFETANFDDQEDILFMIGIGHVVDDVWTFHQFTCDRLDRDEESRIFESFIKILQPGIPVYHWSNAEVAIYRRLIQRYPHIYHHEILWIDMFQIFLDNAIAVRGALNYKLKTIAGALKQHNLIETAVDPDIVDGLDAMIKAIQYYRGKATDPDILFKIGKYNQIDCKLLYEINKSVLRHSR